MLRKPLKKLTGPWQAALLIAAIALFASSCGGSGEPTNGVASIADVEAAVSAEPDPEPDPAPTEAVTEDEASSVESESSDQAATVDDDNVGSTEVADEAPETGVGEGADAVEQTDEEMALAFVACMREQGIDMSDPTVDADGNVQLLGPGGLQQLSDPDFQDAAPNCVDLIETATFFSEAPDLTAIEDSLLEFAQCLRGEGLDVTDPDMSNLTGGPAAIFGSSFDPQDPANAGAIAACQEFLPNVGGG